MKTRLVPSNGVASIADVIPKNVVVGTMAPLRSAELFFRRIILLVVIVNRLLLV